MAKYGERDETRREHFQELRAYLGLSPFGLSDFRFLVQNLSDLAMQTDKGMVLEAHALESLRQRHIILPALTVIERACAEAITRSKELSSSDANDCLTNHSTSISCNRSNETSCGKISTVSHVRNRCKFSLVERRSPKKLKIFYDSAEFVTLAT